MESGAVWFGVIFVLLPVLLFAAAIAVPAYALVMGLVALFVLATGFTVGAAAAFPR